MYNHDEDIDLDDLFNNLITDEEAAMTAAVNKIVLNPPPQPKPLNTKAMSVQLVTRKPTTRFNDEEAAKAARAALGDEGIGGYTTLFKDPTSPVRLLLAEVSAVYVYHKKNTLPYIDRGPRLLPVSSYETYRDSMRTLITDVEKKLKALMPDYFTHVLNDVAYRNAVAISMGRPGRASVNDYPTAAEFEASVSIEFTFAPLPDNSHWLFDVDEEDRQRLNESNAAIYKAATADLRKRLETPLKELIDSLYTKTIIDPEDPKGKKKIGIDTRTGLQVEGTGIFRDTKVTNVTAALVNVRSLAMGDEDVLAVCDAVQACLPSQITDNIDVLRDSPVVRSTAAERLADVASKMGAFFGG